MEGPIAKQQAGAGLGGHCSPGEAETQEQSQNSQGRGFCSCGVTRAGTMVHANTCKFSSQQSQLSFPLPSNTPCGVGHTEPPGKWLPQGHSEPELKASRDDTLLLWQIKPKYTANAKQRPWGHPEPREQSPLPLGTESKSSDTSLKLSHGKNNLMHFF